MSSTTGDPGGPVPTGTATSSASLTDEVILARAGYQPELRRSLRFFSMFAISFSIISITTGIFLNYGFGITHWGPASIWTWPVIGVGNVLIALVVAELGTRIPIAGYAYQWSARLVNPTYGWFVGFAGLLYMCVGGGAIMLEGIAPLFLSEFNVDASANAHGTLALAIGLMILPAIINIISVQVAARVNNVAVFTEILGTVFFGVLLFVLYVAHSKHTPYGFGILASTANPGHSPLLYSVALSSLIGAFTLVGFELAADMSEDAVDPRRSVPRAVIWGTAASVIFGMVALIGFTVAIPSLQAVEGSPLPLLTIAGFWLPVWAVKVLVGLVVFSMFAILVVGSGAQARLAFSLARDNMLPFSPWLRKVHPGTQTPIVALVVFGLVSIGIMIYGYFQASAFGTLVGATAIIPYIIYFLITLAYALKRRQLDSIPGLFSLGKWAWPVIIVVLLYTALIMVILSVPAAFHGSDKFLVYGFVVAVAWYFGAVFWRLRKGTAGVKPVEELNV